MGTSFFTAVCRFVWGVPMMAALLGVGIYCTVRLDFFQFRHFARWQRSTLGTLLHRKKTAADGISQWQSVTTALAATVGTGNIAGVATAIALGGPGAVFWMWLAALLGMGTGFAETVLGMRYRFRSGSGWIGGPMYYMADGLGAPALAALFSICCLVASMGVGSAIQSNSIAQALGGTFGVPTLITAAVVAALAGVVILGGVRRIGAVTEKLVPVMVLVYLAAGLGCLVTHASAIPGAFAAIVTDAFTPRAAGTGGVYGVLLAARFGVSRGLFSNEAGLGSTVMIHAASDARDPVGQGMWNLFEIATDTLVVCTITALIILTSGAYDVQTYLAGYAAIGELGGPLTGVALTSAAFSATYGQFGGGIVSVSLVLFAFSTILGWCWYGERAAGYLFGERAVRPYRIVYLAASALGCLLSINLVWSAADAFNGFMAVPNLIAVVALLDQVRATLRQKVPSG
ncbi:MAG: sodium:alanine symporter family protein [Oscillospiraceae bacterium]|nr:sodium:alanine symporter family protein [Oscillospiraceae bacterium]